jgi:hypothetical protein
MSEKEVALSLSAFHSLSVFLSFSYSFKTKKVMGGLKVYPSEPTAPPLVAQDAQSQEGNSMERFIFRTKEKARG